MVNYPAPVLDATFGALADPTRRAILQELRSGPRATTQLAEPFAMSLPGVLKHLRVLERAGLISGERVGRIHRYRLVGGPMRDAALWLERYRAFWDVQLDALERHVKEGDHDRDTEQSADHTPD